MPRLDRRQLLAGASAFAAGLVLPRVGGSGARDLPPPAAPGEERVVPLDLVAAERLTALPCFGGRALPLWTFSDDWLPIVRLQLGDRLSTRFTNNLPREGEHSSIHWHGLRIPNAEDGVPYMTQPPVFPGETFDYSFVPPDTGTFFFHPHCNTAEQLGRGLAGVLIVEGDESEPYDADEVVVLRDWRIDEDSPGRFSPFRSDAGAAKAGTFGTVRSANGAIDPEIALPASGDCRLRLLNLDNTRVMQVGVEGAEWALVAIDGIALPPADLKAWRLGPAMRADIVVRAPAAGATARLVDYFAKEPVQLARLTGRGPARRAEPFDPAPLRAGRMAEPDLADAVRLAFDFSASAAGAALAGAESGGMLLGDLCAADGTFWAINKMVWPGGDHANAPPPLAVLQRGRTYRATLTNRTPHQHPIHLHGFSFKVLGSSERDLPLHHADTILLQPKERVEIAFVADNPGDWMLHCHIIEHQETGMMGYIRVT